MRTLDKVLTIWQTTIAIRQKQGSAGFDMPMSVKHLKQLSRDPLWLFALCGLLIFMVFKGLEVEKIPSIRVSAETRAQLIENFKAITGRRATAQDIAELEQSYITDELLFREALSAGVHLFDPTTRGSLIEIMRYRITSLIQEPSEEELVSYYSKNIQRYYTEPLLSFEHLYFRTFPANAGSILTQLQSGESINGDSFPHGNNFPGTSESMLRGIFGQDFLSSLQDIKLTVWQGPIASQYGIHYVRLYERISPKPRPFSQARNIIQNDYLLTKAEQAVKTKIEILQTQYEISIEP